MGKKHKVNEIQTVAIRNRHLGSKNCTDRLEVRQLDCSAMPGMVKL